VLAYKVNAAWFDFRAIFAQFGTILTFHPGGGRSSPLQKLLKRLPPFEWIEKQTLLQIFVKLP
jgi:hypothetical protein